MLQRPFAFISAFLIIVSSFQLRAILLYGQVTPLLDLTFETKGSAALFTATAGSITQNNGSLEYTFPKGSSLTSPSFENSCNGIYNPILEMRNTMFFVMENRSSATKLKLSFITSEDRVYDNSKSKVFDIQPNAPMGAFYFNISDNIKAKGRLMGQRIEPLNGSGKIIIDRITFEQETKLEPFAGEIAECRASTKNTTIKGNIAPEYRNKYNKIAICEISMLLKIDDVSKMIKLREVPVASEFVINNIPLYQGNVSRLSSQFLAVVEDVNGNYLKVASRFYIENWRDFENNPYAFKLPKLTANVSEYGANGDGFTDDTDVIQAVINDVSEKGGGQVVLGGDNSFYGKRYIASGAVTGGKAIAFIPWGTDDPNQENQEIYNIDVFDNVLNGGYSVGTWPDNPYGGKQSFDNTETNDYCPVKNVWIYNNKYLSESNLLCIQPTNIITDCGICSSETFQNGNFEHGRANWTTEGNAGTSKGYGFVKRGRLFEGLWLKKGTQTFSANTKGCGELFIQDAGTNKVIEKLKIMTYEWMDKSISINVEKDGTYYLGIMGKGAQLKEAKLN